MTSKEKMSEYLLRLQQWQRMSLGIVPFEITTYQHLGEALAIHVEINSQAQVPIMETRSEDGNRERMKMISDYLHKLKVI